MSQEHSPATLCSFALCKTKCAFPEDCMQLPEPTPLTDAAEQECRCTVNGAIISGVVTAAFTRQLERKARVMQRVLEKQTTVSERGTSDCGIQTHRASPLVEAASAPDTESLDTRIAEALPSATPCSEYVRGLEDAAKLCEGTGGVWPLDEDGYRDREWGKRYAQCIRDLNPEPQRG